MAKRILVTGSRFWPTAYMVEEALEAYMADHPDETFILMSGHCATGADAQAEAYFRRKGQPDIYAIEIHPADWGRYGRAAGPKRNAEMVELGADVCLAFPLEGSRGTKNTIERVREAGIPLRVYSLPSEEDDDW